MTPEKIHPEHSDDMSARSDNGGASATGGKAELHDRFGAYAGLLAAILSAFALGYAVMTPRVYEAKLDALRESNARLADNYRDSELERKLQIMEINGFKNALHAHGIRDVNPHLPGEPD